MKNMIVRLSTLDEAKKLFSNPRFHGLPKPHDAVLGWLDGNCYKWVGKEDIFHVLNFLQNCARYNETIKENLPKARLTLFERIKECLKILFS